MKTVTVGLIDNVITDKRITIDVLEAGDGKMLISTAKMREARMKSIKVTTPARNVYDTLTIGSGRVYALPDRVPDQRTRSYKVGRKLAQLWPSK